MKILTNTYLFLIGLSIGSFLNVLIDRLPKGEKITGRSHCEHCRKQLSGWDLIPVVSFVALGGKSRCCHKKLSFYYPLVEVITGMLFVLIFNFQFAIINEFSISQFFNILVLLGIVSCLIVIFFADFKYQIITDSIQIFLFIFSIFYHLLSGVSISQFLNFLVSGSAVMLPILFLWAVTKGKGMGFGDVKLAFNIGFLLGWRSGLLALYFAFIFGAIVGLVLIFSKKSKLKSKIAFGPFIVMGSLMMIFYQKEIFEIIKKFYGF